MTERLSGSCVKCIQRFMRDDGKGAGLPGVSVNIRACNTQLYAVIPDSGVRWLTCHFIRGKPDYCSFCVFLSSVLLLKGYQVCT